MKFRRVVAGDMSFSYPEPELHEMMWLRNADYPNADYHNADYPNADYRNA
jgi:hypothetical protein